MAKRKKPPGHGSDRRGPSIDRRFPGIGRIHRSSGSSDRRLFEAINASLTKLWEW
jgi:hypothetical protein